MLDTNMVGALIGEKAARADAGLRRHRVGSVCISVVTEGEVLYGLTNNPAATCKAAQMRALLSRFVILPWTSDVASVYAAVRAAMRRNGRTMGALDMLIAAHALSMGIPLATSDRAFHHVPGLKVENWLVD